MVENKDDSDRENADDQAVQARIMHEGGLRLAEEDGGDKADDDEEKQHRPEEGHGTRKPVGISASRLFGGADLRHIHIFHRVAASGVIAGGD